MWQTLRTREDPSREERVLAGDAQRWGRWWKRVNDCPRSRWHPPSWGYLIGDLGPTSHCLPVPAGVQISAGDHAGTVTMPLRSARVVLVRNLCFPGLRRFGDVRRRVPSQLLQVATLAYI